MVWTDSLLDRLTQSLPCGYHVDGPAASEPTAFAALVLLAYGREADAERALDWLASLQSSAGTIGVTADHAEPQWPTSLAVLAWRAACERNPTRFEKEFSERIERAVTWIKTAQGHTMPHTDPLNHDTSIPGWPWVMGTHAWIEPTSFHVLALKATGNAEHPRTRDGVRLLRNRLLSTGGANYGNTYVLGQELRAHVQPTGAALLALAHEEDPEGRIERSLEYLEQVISTATGSSSVSFALLALAAHGRWPQDGERALDRVYGRVMTHDRAPLKLAMLAMAALKDQAPLIQLSLVKESQ